MMRRIAMLLVVGWMLPVAAWALIGTPCDPNTDFVGVYMIRGWKNLPHKNQEETKARVEEVNKRAGKPIWKYDPTPNTPLYVCLSYGAAAMADWWALELGWKLPTYRSYTNGRIETGFNPRKLELRYRKRAKWNPIQYAMVPVRDRCPITNEAVPIRPTGYARLLVDKDEDTIKDYIDPIEFRYSAGDYPMEGEWFSVISKNWDRKSVEQKLINAIHNFGPLYVQFEIPNQHYLFGTHAPIVVGYGKLPDGRTAFICHDSFGKFPKTHKQDGEGANAYRYVVADEIDEAIVFPHVPRAQAVELPVGMGTGVRFVNRGGRPVPVRRAFVRIGNGEPQRMALVSGDTALLPPNATGKVQVYVEAEYYMNKSGKGHWLTVEVGRR